MAGARGHLPRPLPAPAGPISSQGVQTKKRSSIQAPGKKRPGRGRDLPGHAMSVASRQWLFASALDSL